MSDWVYIECYSEVHLPFRPLSLPSCPAACPQTHDDVTYEALAVALGEWLRLMMMSRMRPWQPHWVGS